VAVSSPADVAWTVRLNARPRLDICSGEKSRVFSTFADDHCENGYARAQVSEKKIFLGISHWMCYGEPGDCVRMYRSRVAGWLLFFS
jgi:hypothetical protein